MFGLFIFFHLQCCGIHVNPLVLPSAAASDADAAVAKALGAAPAGEFAHVAKWYASVNK
jgi:hypothetical protein